MSNHAVRPICAKRNAKTPAICSCRLTDLPHVKVGQNFKSLSLILVKRVRVSIHRESNR